MASDFGIFVGILIVFYTGYFYGYTTGFNQSTHRKGNH